MAMSTISCSCSCFHSLTSIDIPPSSLSTHSLFSPPNPSFPSLISNTSYFKCADKFPRKLSNSSSFGNIPAREGDVVSRKNFFGKQKDESHFVYGYKDSGKKDSGRSQSTAFQSPRKDKKGSAYELKEQQAEVGNLQDAAFLNAVVKVFCTHTAPDYSLPWQKQRQYTSTGSAFMIREGKLLTNAHCVEHDTQVKVKRRGDDTKYVAKVLARGVDCDIALLSVENEEFWKGAEPLRFGRLPRLQVRGQSTLMVDVGLFA